MSAISRLNLQTSNRRKRQQGMTMVVVLGFLAVLLMLALALAMVSQTERKAAESNVDVVRTQLLSESALERAVNQIERDFAGNLYPADTLSEGEWDGRRFFASASDATAGLGEALGVAYGARTHFPSSAPGNGAGWTPVLTTNADGEEELIGRYCYVAIDESGKIDPGAVVSATRPEADSSSTRTGSAPSEISLDALGVENPDDFRPREVEEGEPGKMPASGRWFSMEHIAKAIDPSSSEFQTMVDKLYPYSYDTETFWRDRNDNDTWDPGEDEERLNIAAMPPAERIYALFVGDMRDGETDNAEQDDCQWLKDLDNNDWFHAWQNSSGLSLAQARQLVAAQVALNMADYADEDSVPSRGYVDTGGSLIPGTYSGLYNLSGIEKTWGISELAARVECDATMPEGGGGGGTEEGDDDTVEFAIDNGSVVPAEAYTASVTVLGCQVGLYNTRYNPPRLLYWVPTTVRVKVGNSYEEPWGDWDKPVDADVNDGQNPRTLELPDTYTAGTPVSIETRFWLKKRSNYSGSRNRHWYIYRTVSSRPGNARAFVLKDGNQVPEIPCVWNQNSAAYYLQNYVDGSRMSLTDNQGIFLFECASNLNDSIAADYQDIVALVTLAPANSGDGVVVIPDGSSNGGNSNGPGSFGRGHGRGRVNICPANSPHLEFFMELPGGERITRDDLHDRFPDWEGEVTWIHVKPKGNGNQNGLFLGGEEYRMRNGTLYDIIAQQEPMQVTLWNDNRHANGRCMGRWWLMLDGAIVIVPEGEEIPPPPSEEPPPPDTPDDPNPGPGGNLRFRVGFKSEVFHPFIASAASTQPPSSLDLTYTAEVAVATGARERITKTMTIPLTGTSVADGGSLMYTPDYVADDWVEIDEAFNLDVEPVQNWYTVTLLQIDRATLRNANGQVIDTIAGDSSFFCNWAAESTLTTDENFYAGAKAKDALLNDRVAANPDFSTYWSVFPNTSTLALGDDADASDAGSLTYGGYNSAPYCGVTCTDSFMIRLGEIGRVHSYQPLRSLRLWAASSSDEDGSDAAILDLFKGRAEVQTRGKVNINTTNPAVLRALFDGASTQRTDEIVEALLEARDNGAQFTNIGQIFGEISDLSGSNRSNDAAEEASIARVAELLTVRQNYFTVIVCAQAIQDAAGGPYATDINRETGARRLAKSRRGVLDVKRDSDGNVIGYADRILSERKVMAVVYRDAFSGATQVQSVEQIEN